MAVAAVGARDPARAGGRRRSRRRAPGARSRTTASASGELGERAHAHAGLDRAAVLAQVRGEGVGDRARAARARPASRSGGRRRSAPSRPTSSSGGSSGLKAWAATPPNRARACGRAPAPRQHGRRRRGGQPEADQPERVPRQVQDGPIDVLARARRSRRPAGRRRAARRRRPRRARRRCPRSSAASRRRCRRRAGGRRSTSGQRHSSPWRSRPSERRKGEPTAIGCTAEQSSCSRPGTVSSALRVPPPIVGRPRAP